jgi:hypothetical protein
MPWAAVGAVVGAAGSVIAGSQAQSAAKKAANAQVRAAEIEDARLRELAEPSLKAQQYALPALESAIKSQYATKLGKESPTIAAQHGINLTDINRQKSAALGTARNYWATTGNTGRGRGEELQIARTATEAANKENLSYAASQESYKNTNTSNLVNSLSNLAGLGSTGVTTAAAGAQALAQGQTTAADTTLQGNLQMANIINALGGQLYGWGVSSLGKKKTTTAGTYVG